MALPNCPNLKAAVHTQPVQRLLLIGFLIIALVPVGFLAYKLYQQAWENAWREINEKHRLLAQNLTSPISIYINDHRDFMGLMADKFGSVDDLVSNINPSNISLSNANSGNIHNGAAQRELDNALKHMKGVRSLSLIATDGSISVLSQRGSQNVHFDKTVFANEECYLTSRDTGKWALSGIKRSPVSGDPTIILSQPVKSRDGQVIAVLLAELRIDLIEKIRRNIHFGEKGHSAIVDKAGHVIAHPNPGWMQQIRDLSHLSVVQSMMAGKTGVTEFYSPFVKQQMVAGYTAVPEIGWGVMVPQPKSEIEQQVNAMLASQYAWGVIGLVLAILLAIPLARWITQPINRLAKAADYLEQNNFNGELPVISSYAPKEVTQLDKGLRKVISGLQQSREEVNVLNASLKKSIYAATKQLREANSRLEDLAKRDYLTELANRRYFEKSLSRLLSEQSKRRDPICIMLIDIDNFKEINDRYGHAAGDAVLIQIAPILKLNMRTSDIVARYGGDEFVIQMNCDTEVGINRAREIRTYLENYQFSWQDNDITATVSIGLLHPANNLDSDISKHNIETLLQKADAAMYDAKRQGRNTVVHIGY